MQYRSFEKTTDQLSVLGYGCMRLPTTIGGAASNRIDKERAIQQIRSAIDRGVNYLDTAYPYHLGASERFLGEHILKDGYREKVNIATKLPCTLIHKKERIEEIFNEQLNKLQVDTIDYYLLHGIDYKTWLRMVDFGIIAFMDRIKEEGKIRHMGFSFHSTREDFKKLLAAYDWDFCQVQFNILDENFQAGIEGIRLAHDKGMGVFVMEPLRGGALVGRIPEQVQALYDAAPIKRTPADWALRWVWNHPEVTMVLSGMNEEAHIDENISVAEESLPEALTAEENGIISQVRNTYDNLLQVHCTGCAYCMPCPAGINIPAAFKSLNNFHMFSKMESRMFYTAYAGVQTEDGKPHWTSACLDCGKCEKHCPQHLQIREEFKHVRRHFEGPVMKTGAAVGRRLLNRDN